MVSYSVNAMHRLKRFYGEDGEEFKPERWETLRPGWEYLPFNGGPRICLGRTFFHLSVLQLQRTDELGFRAIRTHRGELRDYSLDAGVQGFGEPGPKSVDGKLDADVHEQEWNEGRLDARMISSFKASFILHEIYLTCFYMSFSHRGCPWFRQCLFFACCRFHWIHIPPSKLSYS